MTLPNLKNISFSETQKLIAAASAAAILSFGLGFSFGRQSSVQERSGSRTDSSSTQSTNTIKPDSSETPVVPKAPISAIDEDVDPLTDQVKYTFALRSSNTISNSIGMAERDTLIVRCEAGEVDAYIATTPYVSSDGQSVKLRWNGGAITSEWWSPASGGSALFSGAPVTLLNKMASSEKLVISYKPYSKTAVSAVFEFDQSRSDLKRMQEVCK